MTITEHRKRRGQTWQDAEWRRAAIETGDLAGRARAAFEKLRGWKTPCAQTHAVDRSLQCARTVAPFTGDGIPAEGPFVIRPEYRGFA